MTGKPAEIAAEQAYFDTAAKFRTEKLATLADAPRAAAHPGAAAYLKAYAENAARAVGRADDAVAFGRIDDESGEACYVGRHLIRGDCGVLVVNWQAPAASRYFEASHDDPLGLSRRRTFTCEGNTIQDFSDVVFAELTQLTGPVEGADEADAEAVDRLLLAELGRGRTGSMRDIVATIQAAQYELIRAPMDQVLVIEGGPGTGKTAIALHRVSWLLFQYSDRLRAEDVLVVGPNSTFVHYIDGVLPSLGDTEVVFREVSRLAPDVHRGRMEPAEVARLKGDARMAGLLARALDARVGAPEAVERVLLGGRFVTLPGAEVARLVAGCRAEDLPYAERRRMLRDRLAQWVAQRAEPGGADPRPAVANLVERLWPRQAPAAFLRDLFGSRPRLATAAGDDFTPDEWALLHRRGADRVSEEVWSAADLHLLDELDDLINGTGRRYAHVVVDEAQDLSAMHLRSVARRCATGSMTLVGDLAQATGGWARDSWDEVTHHLPHTHPVAVHCLRYGYRVPRQVYQLAARLLPVAAPQARPPDVVRDGPAEPGIHQVGLAERAGRVATLAMARAADGQFVGIVCPPRCRRETEAALAANGVAWSSAERGELGAAINLVSPQEAKGLEFDAVIVVEPEQIVADERRGHRMLYVALTRTTRYLDIVCAGDPLPLSEPPLRDASRLSPAGVTPTEAAFTERDARRLAEYVAAQVRSAAPESAWAEVLHRTRQLLTGGDG